MRHGSITASQVEAHRVLGRRRADDDLGVTGAACDQFQVDRESAADTGAPKVLADVEIRELSNRGADVRHDDSDANKPPVREGTTRDSALIGVVHEGLVLRVDGVFAVSVRTPGGRVPSPSARNEFRTMLLEEDVDALGAVDFALSSEQSGRYELPGEIGFGHELVVPRLWRAVIDEDVHAAVDRDLKRRRKLDGAPHAGATFTPDEHPIAVFHVHSLAASSDPIDRSVSDESTASVSLDDVAVCAAARPGYRLELRTQNSFPSGSRSTTHGWGP